MTVVDLKKQERQIEVSTLKPVSDELTQKRYYIAELVKKSLDKYLDYDDMVAENTYSLYTLPIVNEELEVIDFEINSLSVHVIATVDRAKNEKVYIPTLYKQYYYKPDMFLFVNFTKNLTKMEIVGFTTDFNFKNLEINKDDLNSSDNLIDALIKLKPERVLQQPNIVNTTKELMLGFVDNDLSEEGKRFFLKHMLQNKEVRRNYKIFYSVNSNFKMIARNPKIKIDNPFDRERRIDIPTRSDYLMDKAISKYNSEDFIESNQENEIFEDEIEEENIEENEIMGIQNEYMIPAMQNPASQNAPVEKIIELSLDPLPLQEKVEPEQLQDDLSLQEEYTEDNSNNNQEESTEYQQETSPKEEMIIDESSIELQENFNEEVQPDEISPSEANSEDASVDLSSTEFDDNFEMNLRGDEEEEVIERIQTTKYHEEDIIEDNLDKEQIMEQAAEPVELTNAEDAEADADLLDIAVDSEEDVFGFINEMSEETTSQKAPNSVPQENANEEQLQTDENGEELFAFLSEMADETTPQDTPEVTAQEYQQPQEIPVQAQPVQMQQQPQSQAQSAPKNTINNMIQNQQEMYNQQQIQDTNTEQGPAKNAFNQFAPQQQQSQYTQQTVKEKKGISPVFILALIFTVLAIGVYKKDDIIATLSGGQQQESGIEEEQTESVPAPIDTTKLQANGADEANSPATTTPEDTVAPPPTTTSNEDNIPSVDKAPQLPNAPKGTTVEPPKPKHLNDAIATALTKDFNGVRISKLSWQASETLLQNPEVKRYLTIAGKSIKNSLSQDLLSATEPSFKDNVAVAITYRKDGSIAKVQMDTSSGSNQIDDIIVKSVKDTLNYIKMPSLNLTTSEYTAKIIIRL